MEGEEEDILSYEDIIHDERLKNKSMQQEEPCCYDSVKVITTHGSLLNDLISLPEGYKVIFIAKFGSCMRSTAINNTELKSIYAHGNSLFENGDTIPKLSEEGLKLISEQKNHNTSLKYSINPTLFIGGIPRRFSDINGDVYSIPVNIPNVSLDFYGDNCSNWPGGWNNRSCMISCIIVGENPEGEDAVCDKYYGTKINLRELLEQEGPGTYVLSTCLGFNSSIEPLLSETLLNYLNYEQFILKNSGITKTRSQHKDLMEKLKSLKQYSDSNPSNSLDVKMNDSFFGKIKSKKIKSKRIKSKKIKSKKIKSKKIKSKSKVSLELKRLQKKAKKLKIRITKKVNGKRKYKTIKKIKKQLKQKKNKKTTKNN